MDEKRKAERHDVVNKIAISAISGEKNLSKEEIFQGHSKDISASGARIRSTAALPVGTYLQVDLTLKYLNEKITALGKVRWIKSVIENLYYELGVEFVNISREVIKKLEDYISWTQKSISLHSFSMPVYAYQKIDESDLDYTSHKINL